MRILICAFCFLLIAPPLLDSQEKNKPKISSVTVLPSDPVVPSGDCKSSTAGYLEDSRPPKAISDGELGKFVSKSLHDGYIVSIYPATKTGIFVTMQCTNTMTSVTP
jgi:hypothetical protein